MAEGQFSPDLLLTVGADLSALRQQLATIQREIGATPLNVGLSPSQSQETTRALNDQKRAVKELSDEVANLRRLQEAQARALKNDLKDIEQAYTQQRLRERKQAEDSAAERLKIEQQRGAQMARDYQNEGRIAADVERQKVRVAQESANERLAIERTVATQIGRIQASQAQLGRLSQQGLTPSQQARAQQLGSFVDAGAQLLAGGQRIDPAALTTLRNEITAFNREVAVTSGATASADGALSSFFGKMGRYTQIAAGLTVVYSAMRAVFAGVQEFVEVDRQLARIAATMDLNADRATVLRDSYDLMAQANKTLGISFSEAGKVVFELEKALGNNSEQIKAAFLPALTLASLGEGNQTEILRTLVGVYKLFGDTLGNTSPQEKYLRISDALIASAAASIQDIDGFRTALQNVAPVAKQAGVSLEVTLASLVVLTNGMQSASRAGTGL